MANTTNGAPTDAPPALPPLPPANATIDPAPTGHDSPGTGAIALGPGILERANAAADDAVAETVAGNSTSPRRRGPDKKPRARRTAEPTAEPAFGVDPAIVPEAPPTPLAPPVPECPAFDRGFCEAGAALTTDLANDLAVTLGEVYALHHLGSEEAA